MDEIRILKIKLKIAEMEKLNLDLSQYDAQEAYSEGYLAALTDVVKLLEHGEEL